MSIVVPTRNSGLTLGRCLRSIREQDYDDVELIVVDNGSTDDTVDVAERWADLVLVVGPERSAQRNAGAAASTGDLLIFIDSDMVLDRGVAREARDQADNGAAAIVIPERIDATGFWQSVRALEKSLAIGDPAIEAARAFRRDVFERVGGYDRRIHAGPEDWDLADRVQATSGRAARTSSGIAHVEESISLRGAFRKKRYYGASVSGFLVRRPRPSAVSLARFAFFMALTREVPRHPIRALALFVLKAVEFAGIAAGMAGWRTEGAVSVYGAAAGKPSLLIATHELFADGAPQALARHLHSRGCDVGMLLLPFPGAPEQRVGWFRGAPGQPPASRRLAGSGRLLSAGLALSLVRDAAALFVVAMGNRRIDTFVGVDPFNCGLGLVFRKLKLWSPSIVLYSIDFVPDRFSSRQMNETYHAIDRWCARAADAVWNVSPAIQAGRTEKGTDRRWSPALTVPIGVERVAASPPAPAPRLVFVGHLLAKQGVRHAVAALPELARVVPDVCLDIIGVGPIENDLRSLAVELGVAERVRFCGYVEDPEAIAEVLSRGGVGLAPYEPDPMSFTRWADPTKLKTYLAAGLPVALTDVPSSTQTLVAAGCGYLIDADPGSIASVAGRILSDPSTYAASAAAALDMARTFLWSEIFEQALEESKPFGVQVGVSRVRGQ